MTPERYKKLTDWLEGHPALRESIILLNRWLPLVPFVCYPVLLVLLNLRWFTMLTIGRGGGALDFMQVIARAILVPGLAFWLGTILRARLNFPRPYEQPGFVPLVSKETHGNSCPSPPRTQCRRPRDGVALLLPCRRRRDAGHRRPHLSAAGAFWGALRPGCAGRRSLRAYVRLCGDVAAVRSLLQKAQKSFKFLLTEPRGYGIILLAACFDSQLRTISEPNGITTCARSSGG